MRLAAILFLFAFYSNDNAPAKLTDCKWNIYRTVEVLSNRQSSYTRVYKDTTYISKDLADQFYNENWPKNLSRNRLGGTLDLNTDSTGRINNADILWHHLNDSTIFVARDTSRSLRFNDYFLGVFQILEINDSSAILQKNLTTNGSWYRTFYLEKRSD